MIKRYTFDELMTTNLIHTTDSWCRDEDAQELEKAVDALIEERDAYHEENEKLRGALHKISLWTKDRIVASRYVIIDEIKTICLSALSKDREEIRTICLSTLSKDKEIFFDKVKDEYISCNIESCFYFDEKHEQNCCYSIPEKCCYRKISKDKGEI